MDGWQKISVEYRSWNKSWILLNLALKLETDALLRLRDDRLRLLIGLTKYCSLSGRRHLFDGWMRVIYCMTIMFSKKSYLVFDGGFHPVSSTTKNRTFSCWTQQSVKNIRQCKLRLYSRCENLRACLRKYRRTARLQQLTTNDCQKRFNVLYHLQHCHC